MNSTSQIIINKANNFFSSYKSKCSCGECNNLVEFKLLIPVIKKICEFDVNSHILFEKISETNEYLYKFEITSKKYFGTEIRIKLPICADNNSKGN